MFPTGWRDSRAITPAIGWLARCYVTLIYPHLEFARLFRYGLRAKASKLGNWDGAIGSSVVLMKALIDLEAVQQRLLRRSFHSDQLSAPPANHTRQIMHVLGKRLYKCQGVCSRPMLGGGAS